MSEPEPKQVASGVTTCIQVTLELARRDSWKRPSEMGLQTARAA